MGVTKAVGSHFGKGGIADRMIWFNGFPFLDNKEEHIFGVPASKVMTDQLRPLSALGMELREIESILAKCSFQGFPIVENSTSKILIGFIGRTELRYAIERAKRDNSAQPHAKCYFIYNRTVNERGRMPSVTFDTMPATSSQVSIDFSNFTDRTPITVHPDLPLETVMDIFKKMGPRVILVEYLGKLKGLITVKDCLKYQFKAESSSQERDSSTVSFREEQVWEFIESAAGWLRDIVVRMSGDRIRLGDAGREQIPRHRGSSNDTNLTSPLDTTHFRDDTSRSLELEDRNIIFDSNAT